MITRADSTSPTTTTTATGPGPAEPIKQAIFLVVSGGTARAYRPHPWRVAGLDRQAAAVVCSPLALLGANGA
jgi:hypothetical protein